jgi:perosamine synthetase
MTKLAIDGGPKVRTKPWPRRNKRFGKEELKELKEALDQNTLFYMHGQKTKKMCAKMARICGSKYVVPCSSGSAALHGATKACGVGPGDEVITSPITDAGTLLGIIYEGAIPVFADIDPYSYNITPQSIAARITSRTRAVIVVHLAGNPADIKPIVRLCKKHKIALIEDCAQSWGAKVDGQWVGTFGDFGCFSLNDFKHIGCGDGGLIVTNDEQAFKTAWLCIDKCYDRVNAKRALYFCAPNYRITELQSAVAIAQLSKVRQITSKRHRLGDRLSRGLSKIGGIRPPKIIKGGYATYWFYLMQIDSDYLGVDPQTFGAALNAEGIPGHVGYVDPVHIAYPYLRRKTAFNHSRWPFSAARKLPPYRRGYCPNAETVLKKCFNFPLGEWLSPADIDDVVKAVTKVAEYYRARR